MVLKGLLAATFSLIAVPGVMRSQSVAEGDRVRLARYDDGMSSGIYAYVRSFGGIIERIDDEGITFSERDPAIVWACVSGSLVVVYLYDYGLVGEDDTVRVRYRFGEESASSTESWQKLPIPKAQMEFFASMMAGVEPSELNPMFRAMMAASSLGAQMPIPLVDGFLSAASGAGQVTFQVTDPADGETLTDSFTLSGFAEALASVKTACVSE